MERERETDRQKERETERDRQTHTHTHTHTQRERERPSQETMSIPVTGGPGRVPVTDVAEWSRCMRAFSDN